MEGIMIASELKGILINILSFFTNNCSPFKFKVTFIKMIELYKHITFTNN